MAKFITKDVFLVVDENGELRSEDDCFLVYSDYQTAYANCMQDNFEKVMKASMALVMPDDMDWNFNDEELAQKHIKAAEELAAETKKED